MHAAVLLAEARVLGAADLDLGDVVGEHPLQEGERARPLDLDLAHVRDVEHPGMRAHRRVLLPDPLVGDRHLPAGERHQLRPKVLMLLVERSAPRSPRPKAIRGEVGSPLARTPRAAVWGRGSDALALVFEEPRHVDVVIRDPKFADVGVLGGDPRPLS